MAICAIDVFAQYEPPPSFTWARGGNITTGGEYSASYGQIRREIIDLEVRGSIGVKPLSFARRLRQVNEVSTYSDSGAFGPVWSFSYRYRLTGGPTQWDVNNPVSIEYPSGIAISFNYTGIGGNYIAYGGCGDRLISHSLPSGQLTWELKCADGDTIYFAELPGASDYAVTHIIDAHGLQTTIQNEVSGGISSPTQIVDASGRWINIEYVSIGYTRLPYRVYSSDGQQIVYEWSGDVDWNSHQLSSASYSDGTSATYTYSNEYWGGFSGLLPYECRDVRASSPTRNIRYEFEIDSFWPHLGAVIRREMDADSGVALSERVHLQQWTNEVRGGATRNFSGWGATLSETDFLGNTQSYGYDQSMFFSRVTDSLGRVTSYTNEQIHGKVTGITRPDGSEEHFQYSTNHPLFLMQHTDELGRQISYQRHPNGLAHYAAYPDGSNEGWSYNQFNQCTTHRLRNGAHEWFEYDSEGRLLRHWLPSFTGQAQSTTYTYYPDGHPWEDLKLTETNPDGHTTTYEYDRLFVNGVPSSIACSGRGLVTKITHHDGTYKSLGYNIYGQKIWEENELRQRVTYAYDSFGRLITSTDPLNRTTSTSYLLPGNNKAVSSMILPSGNRTEYRYDANLRKTEEIAKSPPISTTTTQTVYKIESVNSGLVLDVTGDSVNPGTRICQWWYVNVPSQHWILEDAGNGAKVIKGVGSGLVLDVNGDSQEDGAWIIQWPYVGAASQQWTLEAVGDGSQIIRAVHSGKVLDVEGGSMDALAFTHQWEYWGGANQHWRVIPIGTISQTSTSEGAELSHAWFEYDAVGNHTKTTELVENGQTRVTSYQYDSRNRKIAEYAPLGRTTRWEYDACDNIIRVINADGSETSKTYDSMNRVLTATDEMGHITNYTYWPSGKVRVITDPRGYSYEHLYDASGRLTERKYPATSGSGFGSSERWEYNADGTTAVYYNRSNHKLNYTYDSRNRETRRWWDGNVAPEINTTYDAASRVSSRSNANGTLTINYDVAGQVSIETQTSVGGPTTTINYAYDSDGRRTEMNVSGAGWQGYTYDARGQLSALRASAGDSPFAAYTYDASGHRRTRTSYNGITSDYSYDGAGRIYYIDTFRGYNASNVLHLRFGHDLRDRLIWQIRDDAYGDTYNYQLDSQLVGFRQNVYRPDQNFWNTAARTDSFGYDESGNRTSRNEGGTVTTYQTDALNQYTAVTGAAISHNDGRGNLTQWQDWAYSYDADNRLTYAGRPGYQVWFYYDAMGRLSKLNRNGQWEHRYYDGSQLILRTQNNGTVIDRTIWGPTPDEVIARWSPAYGWQFHHQDHLNSTTAISDVNANIVERYLYDAYGQEDIRDPNWTPRVNSVGGNPWMFTGQELMSDLGLNNYKNRFYHADLGRFIQCDPVRFDAGDLNLYRYVGNNPANLVDPSGEFGFVGALVGGLIGSAVSGTVAYYRGGDVKAAMVGGFVSGALVGSGVGLIGVAVQAGAISTTGALTAGGLVGASAALAGHGAEGLAAGDTTVTLKEAAVVAGVGFIGGATGAGAQVLTSAVKTTTEAVKSTMTQNLVKHSEYLTQTQGASVDVVQNVQNSIASGMASTQASANASMATVAAVEAVAPIVEEITKVEALNQTK